MRRQSLIFRMVTSYWDMAASLVNNGAIDEQMFNDANAEHLAIFGKIEPFMGQLRASSNAPAYLQQLEKLVMRVPDAPARLAGFRERLKAMSSARVEAEQLANEVHAATAAAE
ncbi:MAG: hypothetical protein WKF84_08230 [Pyrinomonadaceae bacterium]